MDGEQTVLRTMETFETQTEASPPAVWRETRSSGSLKHRDPRALPYAFTEHACVPKTHFGVQARGGHGCKHPQEPQGDPNEHLRCASICQNASDNNKPSSTFWPNCENSWNHPSYQNRNAEPSAFNANKNRT